MQTIRNIGHLIWAEYLQPLMVAFLALMSPAKVFILMVQLLVFFELISWEFAKKKIIEKVPRPEWWLKASLYIIALLMARVFEIAFKDLFPIPWVNGIGLAIMIKEARDINRNIKAITGFDFMEEILTQISKFKSTKKDG